MIPLFYEEILLRSTDSLFYNAYYRNTDTLHKYFQGCQLVKVLYDTNGFNPEVPIKIFLKLQNIDMRKIICSTEMDDSRKKYRVQKKREILV